MSPVKIINMSDFLKITQEIFIDKINNTCHSFGHGYIIAEYIAGYSLDIIRPSY